MEIQGRVQGGIVVLDGQSILPEGATVTVTYPVAAAPPVQTGKKRIQVPLVRCKYPGFIDLTNERIGEILDEEDAARRY